MYFDILLRTGVLCAFGVMVATHRWPLLVWALVMLVYFVIQRTVPGRFDAATATHIFGATVLIQCALSIVAAALFGMTGLVFIALGMSANTVAILANGGRMPILGGWSENPCYIEVSEQTSLVALCDLFSTTESSWAKWIISPGDALECIGIWVLAAELVLNR